MTILNALYSLFCITVVSVVVIAMAIMARLSMMFKQTDMADRFAYIAEMMIDVGDDIIECNDDIECAEQEA